MELDEAIVPEAAGNGCRPPRSPGVSNTTVVQDQGAFDVNQGGIRQWEDEEVRRTRQCCDTQRGGGVVRPLVQLPGEQNRTTAASGWGCRQAKLGYRPVLIRTPYLNFDPRVRLHLVRDRTYGSPHYYHHNMHLQEDVRTVEVQATP